MFFNTLLDENAASHIAFGSGFPFLVDEEDVGRVNTAGTHIDFMIGSPELEVDGVTAGGERVPVLRDGNWLVRMIGSPPDGALRCAPRPAPRHG